MTPARGLRATETDQDAENTQTDTEAATGAQRAAEPISTERLGRIRTGLRNGRYMDVDPITDLLTEVDRLHAAEAVHFRPEPPRGATRVDWATAAGPCICGHGNGQHTPRQSASCYVPHCRCTRFRPAILRETP